MHSLFFFIKLNWNFVKDCSTYLPMFKENTSFPFWHFILFIYCLMCDKITLFSSYFRLIRPQKYEYCIYIIVAHLWFLSNVLVSILELISRSTSSITMPCSKSQPYDAPLYQSTTEDHHSSSFFEFTSIASEKYYENS